MAGKTATVGPPAMRKASTLATRSKTATGVSPAGGSRAKLHQGISPAAKEDLPSPYTIMAGRLANRVAELAEGITFIERSTPQRTIEQRKPRKLELRLEHSQGEKVSFSAPFLDNTLSKMLQLQQRMLATTAQLSASPGVTETATTEHAAQCAELSRIIAMICAEKARQGG